MFDAAMPLSRNTLTLSGPDTQGLLQGLFTNNVDALEVGGMQHTALLTPQGKIVDTMFLWRTAEETFVIDVASGRGMALAKKLKLYKLRAAVEIEPTSDTVVVGVGRTPRKRLAHAPDPRHPDLPSRWLASTTDAASDGDTLLRAEEIRLGIPAFGTAYEEQDAFPLGVNLDLLNGIDHHKGCFVGQEVASRMFRKGDVRKRTWHAYGPGLEPCAEISADGRNVAMISAVDGETGLAIVRLDRIDGATEVQATSAEGAEIRLVKPTYLP